MTRVTCPHFKGRPSSELYRVQGRGERDEPERGDVFVGVDVDQRVRRRQQPPGKFL